MQKIRRNFIVAFSRYGPYNIPYLLTNLATPTFLELPGWKKKPKQTMKSCLYDNVLCTFT